eukprot:CAMPEP_0113328384 /NCGR_PEP_ID=MMETSP0010_2-20120614/19989_1 /TAXON_ID=216773 ORGANISM="Corethron hystrix, Strain 308" /NCGR_SAMPLE_ID=MMETSP0010_2 /ASSEMBLY_ACC=CAM_ASM_000155 /LENGTH=1182 /DNA_ID=CAMNT_0000189705 /DNA_START=372 /DNA_END=3919 /DNA_ORIENTATION=- /assembly_acc=CAM_ASM_000155
MTTLRAATIRSFPHSPSSYAIPKFEGAGASFFTSGSSVGRFGTAAFAVAERRKGNPSHVLSKSPSLSMSYLKPPEHPPRWGAGIGNLRGRDILPMATTAKGRGKRITGLSMVLNTPESIIERASTQNLLDDLIDESTRVAARRPIIIQFDPSGKKIWRQWKGTIFSETWPACLRNMALSICIGLLYRSAPSSIKESFRGFNVLWGQLLSVTTFTLTFFLNVSYSLWRKCYELSRRLQGRLNDLSLTLSAHATRTEPEDGEDGLSTFTPQARGILTLVGRYIRLFNLLTYASFTRSHRPILTPRGMRRLVDRGLMTQKEKDALTEADISPTQRHNAILLWIIKVFIEGREGGHIMGGAGMEEQFLEKVSRIAMSFGPQYGAIGDELQGRMPLAYAHIVQILVDAVLWMYPLMAFVSGMSLVLGVIGTGLLTIFYQGLFDLAKQFLDPYDNENYGRGDDPLCIDTLIAETNAGSVRWMNGFDQLPFSAAKVKKGDLSDYILPISGYSVSELEEQQKIEAEEQKSKKESLERNERDLPLEDLSNVEEVEQLDSPGNVELDTNGELEVRIVREDASVDDVTSSLNETSATKEVSVSTVDSSLGISQVVADVTESENNVAYAALDSTVATNGEDKMETPIADELLQTMEETANTTKIETPDKVADDKTSASVIAVAEAFSAAALAELKETEAILAAGPGASSVDIDGLDSLEDAEQRSDQKDKEPHDRRDEAGEETKAVAKAVVAVAESLKVVAEGAIAFNATNSTSPESAKPKDKDGDDVTLTNIQKPEPDVDSSPSRKKVLVVKMKKNRGMLDSKNPETVGASSSSEKPQDDASSVRAAAEAFSAAALAELKETEAILAAGPGASSVEIDDGDDLLTDNSAESLRESRPTSDRDEAGEETKALAYAVAAAAEALKVAAGGGTGKVALNVTNTTEATTNVEECGATNDMDGVANGKLDDDSLKTFNETFYDLMSDDEEEKEAYSLGVTSSTPSSSADENGSETSEDAFQNIANKFDKAMAAMEDNASKILDEKGYEAVPAMQQQYNSTDGGGGETNGSDLQEGGDSGGTTFMEDAVAAAAGALKHVAENTLSAGGGGTQSLGNSTNHAPSTDDAIISEAARAIRKGLAKAVELEQEHRSSSPSSTTPSSSPTAAVDRDENSVTDKSIDNAVAGKEDSTEDTEVMIQ